MDFFLPKFFNDLRSAGALVSNHALAAALLQLRDQLRRKAGVCESLKRLLCLNSHHFPMTSHCILAIAGFAYAHVTSNRLLHTLHISCRMKI